MGGALVVKFGNLIFKPTTTSLQVLEDLLK